MDKKSTNKVFTKKGSEKSLRSKVVEETEINKDSETNSMKLPEIDDERETILELGKSNEVETSDELNNQNRKKRRRSSASIE